MNLPNGMTMSDYEYIGVAGSLYEDEKATKEELINKYCELDSYGDIPEELPDIETIIDVYGLDETEYILKQIEKGEFYKDDVEDVIFYCSEEGKWKPQLK